MYAESYDEEITKQEVLQLRPDWTAIKTKTVVGVRSTISTGIFYLIIGAMGIANSVLCGVLFALIFRYLKRMNARVAEKRTHKNLAIAVLIQVPLILNLPLKKWAFVRAILLRAPPTRTVFHRLTPLTSFD
jgi:hypothetical protein